MSRKWAAGESDSEEEAEVVPTPSRDFIERTDSNHVEPVTSVSGQHGLQGLMLNIKFAATPSEIEEFLVQNHCKLSRVLPIHENERFTGRAIVELLDKESFDTFLSLSGKEFLGMDIITKVYEARSGGGGGSRRNGGRSGGPGGRSGPKDSNNFLSKSTSRDSRDGRYGDFRKSTSRDERNHDEKHHLSSSSGRPIRQGKEAEKDSKLSESNVQVAEEEVPKERKRVVIQPRTLPIEQIGKADKTSDLFGGGKPHDEFQYEERKKHFHQQPSNDTAEDSVPNVDITPEVVEVLKVENVTIQEPIPAPAVSQQPAPEEMKLQSDPPKPPTEEAEEGSNHRKHRSRGGAKPYSSDNPRKFNNNGRSFSKSKSKDDDRQAEVIPEATKAESTDPAVDNVPPEATNKNSGDQDNRRDRRPYRKGKNDRSERSDDREGNGDRERKPHKKNEVKTKKEKSTHEQPREENQKIDIEVKAAPSREEDGFEDFTKIERTKVKLVQKAAAVVTKSTPAVTTQKPSAPPVAVKNSYAGLLSDSD